MGLDIWTFVAVGAQMMAATILPPVRPFCIALHANIHAALVLAVIVVFQPHLAPGLQPIGSAGNMRHMS
jgi:hypothetical protein